MKKLPSKKIWIAISVLLAIILLVILCVRLVPNSNADIDPTVPDATEATKSELRIPDLLGIAKAIKGNLLSALQDIKQNDLESAREKLNTVQSDVGSVRAFMEKMPFLINLIPQAENIYELLNAANTAISEIVFPAIDLLETRPLSELRAGDGFDTRLLCDYIDFLESVIPNLEKLLEAANAMNLSLLDSEGNITEALETANKLLADYHENPKILSMFKTMLGAQEDRTYLIAVQNPSEIRASGGFPGFMGLLQIEDGILTLGKFESVSKFLTTWTPKDIQITKEESALFHYLSSIRTPRDADLCPDFERVGHIWASSYEERHKVPLSGVISITPHIVQRLLAVLDTEIELSDGLVLNGENAIKVLIHDIYFKYYDRRHLHPDRSVISDALFAEAAEKTMEKLTDNFSSHLMEYFPVMKDSIDDRTLILWMRDEEEQSFIIDMGWNGSLNKDPQNPEAGVYVNVVSASKMGWFLLMDTEIGDRTKNADGSYTYPITVTLSNNITQEEIDAAATYISGGLGGAMRTVVYFFAPAGGNVDNFTATNGQNIPIKTYNNMHLGFMDQFLLKPDTPVTITYTVTTAPGVDTPLVISKTPTAQQS